MEVMDGDGCWGWEAMVGVLCFEDSWGCWKVRFCCLMVRVGFLVCWFGLNRRGFAPLSSALNSICLYCVVFTEESGGALMDTDHSTSSLSIISDDVNAAVFLKVRQTE